MKCPYCETSLLESGIIVRVEEERLYMRESFGADLVRTATLTVAKPTRVQCRNCFQVLPLQVAETLRIGL